MRTAWGSAALGALGPWPGVVGGQLGVAGCAGAGFLGGAVGVQFQEAGKDLVAGGVGPAAAPGLLAAAPLVFVDLVVEEEFAVGGDVVPAVDVEDGAVHGSVQGAELGDVGVGLVGLVGVVEAVVGLRHSLAVLDHEGGAEVVVRLADGFEGGVGLPILGEGEGLEAVGGGVAESVFQGRSEESRPDFVGTGLQGAEGRVGVQWKHGKGIGEYHA